MLANMEQNIDTSDRTGLVEDEYYVEKIVDKRLDKHVVLYGVKWQDYPEEDNTEENLDNLFNSLETVKEYEKNRLAKVRFQNPNYDLNHRDRNKLPVDRCPLYVQEMKNTLLDEINKGDVCIFQVLGMTTVKNKRNFFIEFNNKKVAMITDEEVERLPQSEQSKLWDFMVEIKAKVVEKMRQEVRKSIPNAKGADVN